VIFTIATNSILCYNPFSERRSDGMIERNGTHICRHCGEEITWSVFLRKEYCEQEVMMKAKCPTCGTEQKWLEKIKERVA
jgi:hypothetical protein